jgi:hypothetical protein
MKKFNVLRKMENGDFIWMAAASTISGAGRAAKKIANKTKKSVVILNRETGRQTLVS